MKKFLATVAATAAMLVSVHAAEMEGTVKAVDAAAMTVTMEDGTVVKVDASVSLAGVEAGKKVKVTTNESNTATNIEVVQ